MTLESRLSRLEELLGEDDEPTSTSLSAIERRLSQLESAAKELEKKAPHVGQLAREFPSYLDGDVRLLSGGDETAAARCLVVVAAAERLRKQAGLFGRLSGLQEVLSSERTVVVQGAEQQLSQLLAGNAELGTLALEQQQRLFELLSHYDRLMEQISQQFLIWDALVSDAERQRSCAQ